MSCVRGIDKLCELMNTATITLLHLCSLKPFIEQLHMLDHVARDEFLHRCCVQVSSDLSSETALVSEIQHTIAFVTEHARTHPKEIIRALVWRVADTDITDLQDRVGAWFLLNSVLTHCTDVTRLNLYAAMIEEINSYLPYLIVDAWCFGRDAARAGALSNTGVSTSGEELFKMYGPGVVAALTVNDKATSLLAKELQKKGNELLGTWKKVWREDVYQRLQRAVQKAEHRGHRVTKECSRRLEVPPSFRDSLYRLRRTKSRPSLSHFVLRCYGWRKGPVSPETEAEGDEIAGTTSTGVASNSSYLRDCPIVPTSTAEVDALDRAMHPRVRAWLHELVEKGGGCSWCDVWIHTEARCPCERPFLRFPLDNSSGQQLHFRRSHYYTFFRKDNEPISRRKAAEILFGYKLRLPLQYEKVLDCIVGLISKGEPYDELLDAFDSLRGVTTGPSERHAFWIHAGYGIRPSATVFGKPNDDALSPAMERARRHLVKSRRFRQWDQLLYSVDTLDFHFRQTKLPDAMYDSIQKVREANSFFHCLTDGSLPAKYNPESYSCVPKDVHGLQTIKDSICSNCLKPFHSAARCEESKEPWDLRVARKLLDEHNLLSIKYPEESYLVENRLKSIEETSRKTKNFRRGELRLAVKLVCDNRIPYCKICDAMGHSTRKCEVGARQVLERYHIDVMDMCLNPKLVRHQIERLREYGNDRDARMLSDAWEVLGKDKVYPDSCLIAIKEFKGARIPLAAARYCTDTIQGFLLRVDSTNLLQHLTLFRVANFPDVCIFCDSYHHSSVDCKAAGKGKDFLCEIHRNGLTLWEYLQTSRWYDQHFPTDLSEEKEAVFRMVNRFHHDYCEGGMAHDAFIKNRGIRSPMGQRYGGGAGWLRGVSREDPRSQGRWSSSARETGDISDTPLSQLVLCAEADGAGEQGGPDAVGVLGAGSLVDASTNGNGHLEESFAGYCHTGVLEPPGMSELVFGSNSAGGAEAGGGMMRQSLLPTPARPLDDIATDMVEGTGRKRGREEGDGEAGAVVGG